MLPTIRCLHRNDQKLPFRARDVLVAVRRSSQRWLALSICGNVVLAMLLVFKAEPLAKTLR